MSVISLPVGGQKVSITAAGLVKTLMRSWRDGASHRHHIQDGRPCRDQHQVGMLRRLEAIARPSSSRVSIQKDALA